MKARFLLLFAPFMLTGCLAQSQVQYSYDVEKEDCQDAAADAVNEANITKNRAAALKTKFGECMRKQGWKLTTAKPPSTHPPIDAARSAGAVNQAPPAQPQTQGTVQNSTTQPQPQGNPQQVPPPHRAPTGASTYQPVDPLDGTGSTGRAQPGRYFGPRP